jgi:hypothetical protein
MISVKTTHFAGPSSPLATSQVVDADHGVVVAFSISGPEAQAIAETITHKIKHTHVDSPSSFLSLLERVKEQWGR